MNLDPRTVVILTVLSTLFMSIGLFAVARGYLAEMRGVTRWAAGTLLQSIGWIFLALIGVVPAYISELGSPLIMLGLALYYHALFAFKGGVARVYWIYVVVSLNLLLIYYFLLFTPNMAARIVVASATAALLMFASARILLSWHIRKLPVSHSMTGSLFAACSLVLVIRAIYYLVWNTAPDQSAFEHNIVQDVAFLTFFVAAVVSPFTFILMCNDRYNANALLRSQELASKNTELEEASRVKGQFLATMSHELRTPLNGVIGFLNQLGKTRLDHQQKDYLQTIDLSARMLLGVINDVLDFSKIEAGKLSIENIEFNLREFLDEITSMFAVGAEDNGLELVCVIDRNVPSRLMGDPLRLTQVLSNLLGNAIKFTEHGEVLLEVRLMQESDHSVSLQISVSDTGIGISQKSLDRLFQPFVQADASTTRKHGGTGLGLIIARRLVDMMGGRIDVNSEVWKGTRFTISVDLAKQDATLDNMRRVANLSHLRILTVTPNASIARSIAENIAVLGAATQSVDSGSAALICMREAGKVMQDFDAVFYDISVRDISSGEFCDAVNTSPDLGAVHLLLLSNIACCQQAEEIKSQGYAACICKPAKISGISDALINLFAADNEAAISSPGLLDMEAGGATAKPLIGKRVLIVDDNNINRKLVQLLVAELGGDFDSAENGIQAVDACSRKAYDLILMDVNMPVMDGLEATRKIRTLESGLHKTPIIALTANALPGDKERFIASGMDDYLSKPINEKTLLSMLNQYFPQTEMQVQNFAGSGAEENQKESGNATPALDPTQGIKLSFDDPDTWHMVLGMMLDELGEYSGKLAQSAGNLEQLSYFSHKLAGSSCYCGTPALHHAAKQLEIHCTQGDAHLIDELLSHLQLQIDRLRVLDAAGKLRGSGVVVY